MAQFSGVALGVSAAALLALDVPGLRYTEPPKPAAAPTNPVQPPARIDAMLDRDGTAAAAVRLDQAVTRPVVQQQAEAPKTPEVKQEAPIGHDVMYVGPIYEGARTLAVVSVNGKQSIVPEGRAFSGIRLLSVSDERIVVDLDGGQRTIPRQERTGTAVSWVPSMPVNTAMAAGGPNQTAVRRGPGNRVQSAQGRFSPEMEQQLRQGGIDPREAQRWREAARQRTQQNPAVNAAAAQFASEAINRGVMEDRAPIAPDADLEGMTIEEVESVTKEDGEVIITRLRRMHEAGTINEDEYTVRLKQLEDEGKVNHNPEKSP